MKILVADDDRLTCSLLRGVFSKLGHDVITVNNGMDAWRKLKEERIHLVTLDWMMPGLEGVQVCKRLRAEPGAHYTYAILVTGKLEESSFRMGMAAGADDFLTKPVDIGLLATRLRVAERILRLEQEVGELKAALPVCIYCRRIRTDDEAWAKIEQYLAAHADVELSENVCRECYEKHLAAEINSLDS